MCLALVRPVHRPEGQAFLSWLGGSLGVLLGLEAGWVSNGLVTQNRVLFNGWPLRFPS